ANIYVSQVKLKKNLYLLKRENQEYQISEKEKMMLDGFNGNNALSEIAQRLSARFHLDRARAEKIILKFLDDLLEKDILFQIIP
ncbi:MAG: PqqD family protein, partial [Candidatus Omnitrophica bacterium]|nr:PqqD family protein [Candidatus Omnitrophota bacterium]